ncbi:hypothetical protein PGTUg99_004159 [Puccinia graminis f. sp. tritici]|uniref:Uncharacterized protein n=2 Tax=Puccinia graminis f. sp. tritici TaxID=56615 RepID=A0A5B0MM94_PUCGR|nr:hypothetical protein PGTUg99_006321 [Puccinia graminis f. sp. tritici]KAA1081480.1 hypothetical protein PGTUg99_004159 [Puccinia graminis f. sp. tritici]
MKAIEIASQEILTGLSNAAPTYRPETYNVMSLLELLKPGQVFAIHTKNLAHNSKLMLNTYLLLQLVATALYVPTSVLALRGLRNQLAPKDAAMIKASESSISNYQTPMMKLMNDGTAKDRKALEGVRKRLVKHSCLLYLDAILYFPILFYMASHVHTAIIGNTILALLIQNTLYTIRKPILPARVAMQKSDSYSVLQRETMDKHNDIE